MKVTLQHFPLLDVDGAHCGRIEAEHDAAMDLRLNPKRVNRKPAIDHTDDPIYGVLAVIGHGDFNGIRNGGYRVNARGDPSPLFVRPSARPIQTLGEAF